MKKPLKTIAMVCIAAFSLSSGSFATEPSKLSNFTEQLKKVDETIGVTTSSITGANDVLVLFNRSGAEAGWYEVTVTYTVRFNEGTTSERTETFTEVIAPGLTETATHIQGPNPTISADVLDVSWSY